jgi:hypothetical protein
MRVEASVRIVGLWNRSPSSQRRSYLRKPAACWRLLAGEKEESRGMLDILMLVIGIGFFALAVAYAVACDRL